jgi:hypothetical protein
MQTDRGADRQTYMTTLIVAFRNFANAPKNAVENVNSFQLLAPLNLLFVTTTS